MSSFISTLDRLIYGTGNEALITPNHRDWLAASSNGEAWINHHIENAPNSMLTAFEAWIQSQNLPPLIPWNGVDWAEFSKTDNVNAAISHALPAGLDGSFTGITSVEQLGQALKTYYQSLVGDFSWNGDLVKAAYHFRFWSFLKWASLQLRRFRGEIFTPPRLVYDRDGTALSALPLLSVVNEVHWRWHDYVGMHGLSIGGGSPAGTTITPGYSSAVGQRVTAIHKGDLNTIGDEFFRFHRDHVKMLSNWLERLGQPLPHTIDMRNSWPRAAQAGSNPSVWTETPTAPWIDSEPPGNLPADLQAIGTLNDMGHMVMQAHADGHNNTADITSGIENNFSLRFFSWHIWVDSQWFWREPRFARWNPATKLRERTFQPVLFAGGNGDWPGIQALTIVRDTTVAQDSVSPAGALSGLNLVTGAGTLRMKFFAKDPNDRKLTLKLTAEVFNDAVNPSAAVETVLRTFTVGSGGDFNLDTDFTVDFNLATAFKSDDPNRAVTAVGFVNSRIRISGSLEVADGSDPGFVHHDFTDIILVQEKDAPQMDIYLQQEAFSEDQVVSNKSGTESRFKNALMLVVQDRTSRAAAISWPSTVADELKGLLQGLTPAAGLFKDAAHSPSVTINGAFTGIKMEPAAAGPSLEDPSLADNLPQRFTYNYDLVFQSPNNAFDGLPPNGAKQATFSISTADRCGNTAQASTTLRFLKSANPYMRDGNSPWLSIDTRVFHLFQGENFNGEPLAVDQPTAFIHNVINKLNNTGTPQATRDGWFDSLPSDEDHAVLEYSPAITDHTNNTTRKVYNFALAKVRLQGVNGAANVRAFFRLFRYSATNLTYNANQGYRFFSTGATPDVKVPLLGFASTGELISIPFFAADRIPYSQDMTTQRDDPNVKAFPLGNAAEQVLYFGAYLDINQDAAQLPSTQISAHPNGPFAPAEVKPIRSLIYDAHCCMVAEIKFDGKPTETGETPFTSDNLAQRNLAIVQTDNPGSLITHTVEHSFEVELGQRHLARDVPSSSLKTVGVVGETVASVQDRATDVLSPDFTTTAKTIQMVKREAINLAVEELRQLEDPTEGESEQIIQKYVRRAESIVRQKNPLVFDPVDWMATSNAIDELLLRWNGLPPASFVEIYLPSVSCEDVLNLRALRHAPGDVKIIDSNRLRLVPHGGVTYLPLPPSKGSRIAGTIRVQLPDKIRRGQRWRVDVLQLQGYNRQVTGAFQLNIQVSSAALIFDAEVRLLGILFDRLRLTLPTERWFPILQRRVATTRARAQGLAAAAQLPFQDPTTWTDPRGGTHPLAGERVRIVLEKIEVNKCNGLGELLHGLLHKHLLRVCTRVRTEDNGVIEERHVLPSGSRPGYALSGTASTDVVHLEEEVFRGYVDNDLAVEIAVVRLGGYQDTLCKYKRLFNGPVQSLLGRYKPNDEPIDPEIVGAWEVWYRIERA